MYDDQLTQQKVRDTFDDPICECGHGIEYHVPEYSYSHTECSHISWSKKKDEPIYCKCQNFTLREDFDINKAIALLVLYIKRL